MGSQSSTIRPGSISRAGENDLILQAETEKIADLIPDSTLVILEGEDHGSYIVNSEIMGGLLIDFLNREWLE